MPRPSSQSTPAALEAMACSRPVITTAVGGLVDLIEDRVNGLLVGKGGLLEMLKAKGYKVVQE